MAGRRKFFKQVLGLAAGAAVAPKVLAEPETPKISKPPMRHHEFHRGDVRITKDYRDYVDERDAVVRKQLEEKYGVDWWNNL